MDATLLLPLADRAASFAGLTRLHPAARTICENADGWARRRGLITGDPDGSPLGRARLGRLAARVFPDAAEDRVTLFAQWLVWLYAFDDARDESPLGGSATAVDTLYSHLFMSLRRGHPRPGSGPLEIALTELWRFTSPLAGRSWRCRFLARMEEHRSACGEEAVNRRTGQMPAPGRYPSLRRRTSGLFMFDLAETVLGVEPAPGVLLSPAWQNLLQGTADLITWCNDVASYRREAAWGATHNYVTVFARAFELTPEQTAAWVVDRIAERASEVQAAARQLPVTYTRLGLDAPAARRTDELAEVFLAAPRSHLEWLLESGRYRDRDGLVPRQPGPAPGAALPGPARLQDSAGLPASGPPGPGGGRVPPGPGAGG